MSISEDVILTKEELNMRLYQACVHLYHAGKQLNYFDTKLSLKLFTMAEKISSIIDAPERKITDEEMNDLLNDILNSDN